MIISYSSDITNYDETTFKRKILALEESIRAYTHNDFNLRAVRFLCNITNNHIDLNSDFIKVNDTVEISNSKYNNGIYNVENNEGILEVNSDLFNEEGVTVTLVRYPNDIKEGCIRLFNWEYEYADKVGVASESISRHNVSYVSQDDTNTDLGYPISLLGFLKPYMRART